MVATHGHLTQKDFLGGGWVRSLNLTGWVGNLIWKCQIFPAEYRVFQFSIWRSLKIKSPLPWANGLERKINIVRNDASMSKTQP